MHSQVNLKGNIFALTIIEVSSQSFYATFLFKGSQKLQQKAEKGDHTFISDVPVLMH